MISSPASLGEGKSVNAGQDMRLQLQYQENFAGYDPSLPLLAAHVLGRTVCRLLRRLGLWTGCERNGNEAPRALHFALLAFHI